MEGLSRQSSVFFFVYFFILITFSFSSTGYLIKVNEQEYKQEGKCKQLPPGFELSSLGQWTDMEQLMLNLEEYFVGQHVEM